MTRNALTGDETDAALEDRKGWAFEGCFQDQSSGAASGDATPCHWVLTAFAAPIGRCECLEENTIKAVAVGAN